jgi:hypothetical protein
VVKPKRLQLVAKGGRLVALPQCGAPTPAPLGDDDAERMREAATRAAYVAGHDVGYRAGYLSGWRTGFFNTVVFALVGAGSVVAIVVKALG